MKYLFVGDPLCSWCYGFAKELGEARVLLPGFDFDIKVAGLWAGGRDVLDDQAKRFRLGHWERVEAAAGVPFNRDALWNRQNFVYDTGPISRAFIAGKQLLPGLDQLALFRALQQAFYVDGLDTTSGNVLAGVVQQALTEQGLNLPESAILGLIKSSEIVSKTQAEFELVRSWGLRSFPQLLCLDGERVSILHSGFEKAAQIVSRITLALPHPIEQVTSCPTS